jgi:hypothetical protein
MWAGTTAVTFAGLLVRNLHIFTARIYADGDFAANGILIDRALKWRLLVGNYSRFRFHHPGPALLYVQAWSQWLFHDVLGVVPTPYNGQLLGILLLNAVLLGGVAVMFLGHMRSPAVAIAGVAAVATFALAHEQLLSSTWMPHAYFAPFLLFTVAVGSVAAGRWASLPWLGAGGGFLVHGHASFLSFVLPAAGIAGLALLAADRGRWREAWRDNRRSVLVAGAVLAVFVLPMALNVVLHWPGEFGKYWLYVRKGPGGHHTLAAVLRYARGYWLPGIGSLALLAAVGVAVVTERDAAARRFAAALVGSCLLMTALFLYYGLRGVDDLRQTYIGLFYLAVPGVLIAVVAMAVARRFADTSWRGAGVAVGAVALLPVAVALSSAAVPNPYRGDQRYPALEQRLATAAPRAGRPAAITFDSSQWPVTVGLVYYAAQHHLRTCIVDGGWEFIFTERFVCTRREQRDGWPLSIWPVADVRPGAVVFADDRAVVRAP